MDIFELSFHLFRGEQLKGQSRRMEILKIYKTGPILVYKVDAFNKFFE